MTVGAYLAALAPGWRAALTGRGWTQRSAARSRMAAAGSSGRRGQALAFKLIEAAQARWRAVNER